MTSAPLEAPQRDGATGKRTHGETHTHTHRGFQPGSSLALHLLAIKSVWCFPRAAHCSSLGVWVSHTGRAHIPAFPLQRGLKLSQDVFYLFSGGHGVCVLERTILRSHWIRLETTHPWCQGSKWQLLKRWWWRSCFNWPPCRNTLVVLFQAGWF